MCEILELSILKECAEKEFAPQLQALRTMPPLEVNEIEQIINEDDPALCQIFHDLRRLFNF